MRLSYQGQYELAQDLASDSDATNKTLLQNFVKQGNRKLQAELGTYITDEQRTFTTVTDAISGTSNQAYSLPENFRSLVELYVTVGTTQYNAELIQDYELWRQVNSTTTSSTSDFLQFCFVKNDRIELYPIPSSANTATLRYRHIERDLTQDDYTTGTITTLANGGTAVTGSTTTWTAAMVGRYFRVDSDGEWYKISARSSDTAITLERAYQGVSISAGTEAHTIGQLANLPPDTYELPVYYAVWRWSLFRKDVQLAREFERMWKEGVRDAKANWGNISSSAVIHDKRNLRQRGILNNNFWPENMS